MKISKEEFKSAKASYPIGEAKEDWKIFNSIIKQLNRREEILKFDNLRKESLGK